MVDRGWIPRGSVDSIVPAPATPVVLDGFVRAYTAPGAFLPENEPDTNNWFHMNEAEMLTASGLSDGVGFYVEAGPAGGATENLSGGRCSGCEPAQFPSAICGHLVQLCRGFACDLHRVSLASETIMSEQIFKDLGPAHAALGAQFRRAALIDDALGILSWDQATIMPEGSAGGARGTDRRIECDAPRTPCRSACAREP